MNLIIKAAQYANALHEGQFRKYSGLPYIVHPLRVMSRAMLLPECDERMAAVAVLHDVIEDCGATIDDLDRAFGWYIACGVQALTNPSKDSKASRAERKAIDRERIKNLNWEGKVLKMIDRIDNLRDIPDSENFKIKYMAESRLLLDECLRGIHPVLEKEFDDIIGKI